MLELNLFSVNQGMHYYGMNHYTITRDNTGFTLHVKAINDDGNTYNAGEYAASSLSSAIATIEALERGETI